MCSVLRYFGCGNCPVALPDCVRSSCRWRTPGWSTTRRRRRQPVWCQYDVASDLRSAASAEHDAMELLGAARVVELLRDLPADQREVLVLQVVADLSVQEVATVIGRSPGAVKQLQHRAVRKLRQIVIEQGVTASGRPTMTTPR